MGGRGSGTWYRNKKIYVDDCLCLDINRMVKLGAIPKYDRCSGLWKWTNAETEETINYEADTSDIDRPFIRIHYVMQEGQHKIDYKIYLSRTKTNYGCRRFWFICPINGKRVSKLYLYPGGDIFASRHAYNLTYASQSEKPMQRAFNKKWKILQKTGGDEFPIRPKGMHQKTFDRIMRAFREQEELCNVHLMERASSILAGL